MVATASYFENLIICFHGISIHFFHRWKMGLVYFGRNQQWEMEQVLLQMSASSIVISKSKEDLQLLNVFVRIYFIRLLEH